MVLRKGIVLGDVKEIERRADLRIGDQAGAMGEATQIFKRPVDPRYIAANHIHIRRSPMAVRLQPEPQLAPPCLGEKAPFEFAVDHDCGQGAVQLSGAQGFKVVKAGSHKAVTPRA